MPSIGTFELLTILVVVLVLFGPAKLPDVGRQIGRAVREVRRVESSIRSEWVGLLDDPAPGAPPPTLPPRNDSGTGDARVEPLGRSAGKAVTGATGGADPGEDDPPSDPRSSGGPAG